VFRPLLFGDLTVKNCRLSIRLLWPDVLAKLMVTGSSELQDAATVPSMLSDVQDSASL